MSATEGWDLCRNGIDPIIRVLERIEEPSSNTIEQLVSWLSEGGANIYLDPRRLKNKLDIVINKRWLRSGSSRTLGSTRLSLVETILKIKGFPELAREFRSRIEAIRSGIDQWELHARDTAARRRKEWQAIREQKKSAGHTICLELQDIVGRAECEAFNDMLSTLGYTIDWLHACVSSLRQQAASSGTGTESAADESTGFEPDLDSQEQAKHSDDFRSVVWFGREYEFTATQAACIRILWGNWNRGTPSVGEQTILENADSNADRLRDVFASGNHPAWGQMIQSSTKGAFKLGEPKNT